jgi:hypothetical protein
MTHTDFIAAKKSGAHVFKPVSPRARTIVNALSFRVEKGEPKEWIEFPSEFGRFVMSVGEFPRETALSSLTVRPALADELTDTKFKIIFN